MVTSRLLSRAVCIFMHLAAVMIVAVVVSFIWLERSSPKNVFFAGPVMPSVLGSGRELVTHRVLQEYNQAGADDSAYPVMAVRNFDCAKLFNGAEPETRAAVNFLESHRYNFKRRDDDDFSKQTINCDMFKEYRRYWTNVTKEEEEFPIAYNIIFHRNVDQFERLLRAIWRPQNQYCIHMDRKTPDGVQYIIGELAQCFNNVFIASKLEIMVYMSYTRLQADINCMTDHVERGGHWKYLLNVASSEFPLRTNHELVRILKIFNGANDIHEVLATRNVKRFKEKHFTFIDERNLSGYIIHSKKKKDDPPYGLTITKGNAYNVFSRAFVEFVLDDPMADDLLSWSADTLTPDEHYWATLNNLYSNPFLKTPGGFKGHPDKKPYVGRYIGWNTTVHSDRCQAKHYVHNICVFSVRDLPQIKDRIQLFANKFDIEYDPIAYTCMEELLANRTSGLTPGIDLTPFRRLSFIHRGSR